MQELTYEASLLSQDFLTRAVSTGLDRDTGPTIAIGPQLVNVLLILVAVFSAKGP